MNSSSYFATAEYWSIIFLLAGVIGIITPLLLLTSKYYCQQYLANLRYYAQTGKTDKWLFGIDAYTYLWVKMFGPDKFYKIARRVLAPLGVLISLACIGLGLYLKFIK